MEIEKLREELDGRLLALVPRTETDQHRRRQATTSALLAPGKRLRPLCVILAGRDLGCREATIPDLGCAVGTAGLVGGQFYAPVSR